LAQKRNLYARNRALLRLSETLSIAAQCVSGNAVGYAIHSSRSHDTVIRVHDSAGNIVETHEHKGDFKEW